MRVNGVDLSYVEQGTGATVVFAHSAFSDARFWEPQRETIPRQYRFVAYDYRYHGTAPWPDDGKRYSATVHAADLAALIRGLNAGPVQTSPRPALRKSVTGLAEKRSRFGPVRNA